MGKVTGFIEFKRDKQPYRPVAARLLVDWERSQSRFVKVIPQDYKRVMAAIKKAQETGTSADDAVMASAHN